MSQVAFLTRHRALLSCLSFLCKPLGNVIFLPHLVLCSTGSGKKYPIKAADAECSSARAAFEYTPRRRTRDQLTGPCPIHGSTSETSRIFSVNLTSNAFQCFKCGAKGNQIDLWSQANNLSLHDAALRPLPETRHRPAGSEAPLKAEQRGSRSPMRLETT